MNTRYIPALIFFGIIGLSYIRFIDDVVPSPLISLFWDYYKYILLTTMLFFSFYGFVNIYKDIVRQIPRITRNQKKFQILTISITILAITFTVYLSYFFITDINNSDRGIIFEIVGFIIYLTPVHKILLGHVKEDELLDSNDEIIKTSAITLVVIGLLLQLSFFATPVTIT